MNNKLLLLAAAGTLALASCQNETAGTDNAEMMQAKIDSAVQARMGEMQAQLAAQNDSLINAMAMMKADSMMAAAAGNNNTGVRRTVPTRSGTRPTTVAPSNNTVGNGKPAMGGDNKAGSVGNGKPAMGADNQKSNTTGNGKPKMGDN